jgi:hypothetical protein
MFTFISTLCSSSRKRDIDYETKNIESNFSESNFSEIKKLSDDMESITTEIDYIIQFHNHSKEVKNVKNSIECRLENLKKCKEIMDKINSTNLFENSEIFKKTREEFLESYPQIEKNLTYLLNMNNKS